MSSYHSCVSFPAYIVAVYHSMKEEIRRNSPGNTPIKRRANSQISQEPTAEAGVMPGEGQTASPHTLHKLLCSIASENPELESPLA